MKIVTACLTISSLYCFSASITDAQVAEVATITFAGKTAGSILNEADSRANALLVNGQNAANRAVSNAGVEMSVLLQNFRTAFNEDLNKKFELVDNDERNAFNMLNAIISEANDKGRQAENIEDNLSVDISRRLDQLPFIKKQPLFITRVRGLYQSQRALDYIVEVSGKGFGVGDGARYELYVSTGLPNKNNQRLTDDQFGPSKTNKDGLLIRIPTWMVNDAFLPNSVRRTSLNVKAVSGPAVLRMNFPLFLLPQVGATLTLTPTVNQDGWEDVPGESEYDKPWQGNGSGGSAFFEEFFPYSENVRLTSVRLGVSPDAGCNYCTPDDGKGLGQFQQETWDNQPDQHRVRFHAACHGDRCTIKWFMKFQRKIKVPTAGSPQSQIVGFGQQTSFDLPADTIDWQITGTFYNGQKFSFKKGVIGQYFTEGQSVQVGPQERIVIAMKDPFAVTE
jgi:hypothetical protein